MKTAAWRGRRARGRRTAGAFSYSTQPPRPVGELTMAAEVNVGKSNDLSLFFVVGAYGRTPLPSNDIALALPMPALPLLPGLPTTLDVARAAERLTLSAPALDEWLSSRKDKRL